MSESDNDMPERLYLEHWPEETGREDTIWYEPTGAGIDMRSGASSEITVYVREDLIRQLVLDVIATNPMQDQRERFMARLEAICATIAS